MTDLGPFTVTVDSRMTFEELVSAGRYDRIDQGIEKIRPLIERGLNRAFSIAGKRRAQPTGGSPYRMADPQGDAYATPVQMGLITFWEDMDPRAAPAFADMLGKRLARPEELLAFVATQPSLPEGLSFVAIGGSTDIIDGRLPAMVVACENGRRSLFAEELCRSTLQRFPVLLASL